MDKKKKVATDKKKKVAIVGFAPSTRHLAPFNNQEWEIWTLNEFQSILPVEGANNITRWFELHQRDTVLTSSRDPKYIDKLKASTIPIMMCEKYDDIPMSEAYPLDDIIKALETDYFTNSISYMVAYAVYAGYEEIAIYGVDMAQDEEYAKERPSVEYFVGYARAKGIPVYIPPESDICKVPYYYGFQEESASKICRTIDPKRKDLVGRINTNDYTVDEMLEHMDFHLKSYLFNNRRAVDEIRANEKRIKELLELASKETDEEKKKPMLEEIHKIQTMPLAIDGILYPMDDILMKLWECNQNLKGAKKERLFLAGANDIATHLRTILCPFD
jgi:hypothetical protein